MSQLHFFSILCLLPIYEAWKENELLPLEGDSETFQQPVLLLLQVEDHLQQDCILFISHENSQHPRDLV